jgi:hypothetical protein
MAGNKIPGPVRQMKEHLCVRDGTMCVAVSPLPGPVGALSRGGTTWNLSGLLQAKVEQGISIPIAELTTRATLVRSADRRASEAIEAQARQFVRAGGMTIEESRAWFIGQRNALMIALQDESSAVGRIVGECASLSQNMNLSIDIQKLEKSAEGVIVGSRKKIPWANHVSFAFCYLGPAQLTVQIDFLAHSTMRRVEYEYWRVTRTESEWCRALIPGTASGSLGCKPRNTLGSLLLSAENIGDQAASNIMDRLEGSVLSDWTATLVEGFKCCQLSKDKPVPGS